MALIIVASIDHKQHPDLNLIDTVSGNVLSVTESLDDFDHKVEDVPIDKVIQSANLQKLIAREKGVIEDLLYQGREIRIDLKRIVIQAPLPPAPTRTHSGTLLSLESDATTVGLMVIVLRKRSDTAVVVAYGSPSECNVVPATEGLQIVLCFKITIVPPPLEVESTTVSVPGHRPKLSSKDYNHFLSWDYWTPPPPPPPPPM